MMKLFSILCAASFAFGEIVEAIDMDQVKKQVENCAFADLVLFDIDYTLVEPEHPALHMNVIKQNKKRFRKELEKCNANQRMMLPIIMATHTPSQLTEPSIPQMIGDLREKNTVLGLTAADTAAIPEVGSIPAWREKELKRLGIAFTQSSDDRQVILNVFAPFRGTYPIYQNGIIYSNVINEKGSVLLSYLDAGKLTPKGVVFIDDSPHNLESVQRALSQRNIPFLGIHYRVPPGTQAVSDEEWDSVWEKVHKRLEQFD